MIVAPGRDGAAFTDAGDGDMRRDETARTRLSSSLNISPAWASVRQVHGAGVVQAREPGEQGEADAVWTSVRSLPLAVFTADCLGVVLHGDGAVGVAHAGWRGAAAGVVAELRRAMEAAGVAPLRAWLGPGIEPCCFEVGAEVAQRFPGRVSTTTWGSTSVDLSGAVTDQLDGLEVWNARRCTRHHDDLYSHRRNRTRQRMAAIGWMP